MEEDIDDDDDDLLYIDGKNENSLLSLFSSSFVLTLQPLVSLCLEFTFFFFLPFLLSS